jgi:hypothetical protein
MSDDIVTRLRDEPPTLYFGNHQHWCEVLGIMDDAADEIERLRAEVTTWRTVAEAFAISGDAESLPYAGELYAKAVRHESA